MGVGGILILLLLLVSVLVFGFLVFKSARGWGVLHTLLICTLFIECWVFLVFAAGVQGTRVKFTKAASENQARAEAAEQRTTQLQWGSGDVNSVNIDGVIPAKGELRRQTSDQGRVWRGLSFLQENNGNYELELVSADAPADDLVADAPAANAVPSSESLPVNLVVYAFASEPNEDNQMLPVFYLGEYLVTASQDGLVTLKPTIEPLDVQSEYISAGNAATWTLYELLPVDSHRAFAAPGSQSTDEEIFGRMDEETLTELFAGIPEGERRQKMLDTYLRDGKRAADDDPLKSVWVQLNMLKNYEDSVDSLEDANATERGYFDTTGRSIDARLKRGADGEDGTVQLTPNDKGELIVMKAEAAQTLIDNGTAELVQRLFVRPLIDYEHAFNTFVVSMHEVSERIDLIQREIAQLQRANQLGQEQISEEQVENQRLNSDLANYQKELNVLNKAINGATQDVSALKSEMGTLYRNIQSRSYESF